MTTRVQNKEHTFSSFSFAYIPPVVLLLTLGLFTYSRNYPIEVSYWVGVLSLLTLILYIIDKARAKRNKWRISENKLQLLSILGGWPGAIVAQQVFRHKTVKASFQRMFWLCVVINSSIIAWTFTEFGSSYLNDIIYTVGYYLTPIWRDVTQISSQFFRNYF